MENRYDITIITTDCALVGMLYTKWYEDDYIELGNGDVPSYDYSTATWSASFNAENDDCIKEFITDINNEYGADFSYEIYIDYKLTVKHITDWEYADAKGTFYF